MAIEKGRIRGILGKLTNVSLIFLGFLAVFFTSHSDSSHNASGQPGTQDDMLGTNVVHADAPVSSYSSASGSASSYSSSGGSGSGGCGAGDGGCGAGGAGSGCGY